MSKSTRGLSEKGAALLSYVLGWLTGLIIFLIDKRPYVRFHAAQSIVVFGSLHVIQIVIAATSGLGVWQRWQEELRKNWRLECAELLANLVVLPCHEQTGGWKSD